MFGISMYRTQAVAMISKSEIHPQLTPSTFSRAEINVQSLPYVLIRDSSLPKVPRGNVPIMLYRHRHEPSERLLHALALAQLAIQLICLLSRSDRVRCGFQDVRRNG